MREQLIAEVSSIEDEKFARFILDLIISFKRKWGVR